MQWPTSLRCLVIKSILFGNVGHSLLHRNQTVIIWQWKTHELIGMVWYGVHVENHGCLPEVSVGSVSQQSLNEVSTWQSTGRSHVSWPATRGILLSEGCDLSSIASGDPNAVPPGEKGTWPFLAAVSTSGPLQNTQSTHIGANFWPWLIPFEHRHGQPFYCTYSNYI